MITARVLIDRFTEGANRLLVDLKPSESEDQRRQAVQALRATLELMIADDDDHDERIELLDHLQQDLLRALFPSHFFNLRVGAWDTTFKQTYALMEQIFEPDVLDEADIYRDAFPDPAAAAHTSNFIMVSRFWRASGAQTYDAEGRLVRFGYDPLLATEEIAATASGTYMSLGPARPGEAIAAIGYAATRPGLLRQGHGYSVVADFERVAAETAAARGETLTLLMLESEVTATAFWSRCGYRWPKGSKYMQPPISFNPETGEPNYPAKLEIMMVKAPGGSGESIDSGLLLQAMRTMLGTWFRPSGAGPEAMKKVDDLLFGTYYREFEDSVAEHGALVPLVLPPSAE